ncbi:hypothetical protein FOZ63_014396 [Perkinsus olseni]|uniref:Uncharacterized protein n=1 Tax=Perkinsus olseni TaxID=32597 RepID=A0A7J6SFY4_PEROL|nr:hypothetical protein FOZ63_014396 [Perkinsus olseni]
MILIFDEIGEVVFASMNGGTEPIDHVRYYFVGTKPGALLTIAYTPGEQAHFLVLREYRSSLVTVEEAFYDMNTIYRWDDVSGSPAVFTQEQPTLPTGRSQSGDLLPFELASRVLVTAPEWFSLYVGREWLFGRGARNDEYFLVPIWQRWNDTRSPEATEDTFFVGYPPTRAIILHADHEGVTHYYETFVDTPGLTETCFFGIQEWEYPLSDGQSEKPLKDRILSMDHRVTEELNGLCKNGSLFTRGGRHPTKLKDWEPDLGNYTGSVGNGTLRVELTVEGRENRGLPENHTLLIAPIMHDLIGFLYPTGVGEREAKVVILRLSGMNEENYVSCLGAKFFRGFTRVDQQGWDMILYETRSRFE